MYGCAKTFVLRCKSHFATWVHVSSSVLPVRRPTKICCRGSFSAGRQDQNWSLIQSLT